MSGISGYGSVGRDYSLEGEGAAPEQPAAEPVAEGQIVRGGPPATAAVTEALTSMTATQLQQQLMAADDGLTKTEAKAQAKEIKATAAEVEELQAQLKDLKDLEKVYEDMLADPSLDPWEASWIESDLWDLRFDIYDIEDQLGELQGSLEDLMGKAWDGLLGSIQESLAVLSIGTKKIDDVGANIEQRARFSRRERDAKAKLDRDRDALEQQLREKGVVIPVPPRSEVGKKITADLRKALDEASRRRDADTLEMLRSARQRLVDLQAPKEPALRSAKDVLGGA